jgi:hypothetical protein
LISALVNAVVILAAMILIVEPSAATIDLRKKTLFSIMDFNGLGRISLDEMVSCSHSLSSLCSFMDRKFYYFVSQRPALASLAANLKFQNHFE